MSTKTKDKKRSVTIELCREILGEEAKQYSDKELAMILDWMYQIAEIEYTNFIRIKNEKKSNPIHKGIHRRTGR